MSKFEGITNNEFKKFTIKNIYEDNDEKFDYCEVCSKYTNDIIYCLVDKPNKEKTYYKPLIIIENPDDYNNNDSYQELIQYIYQELKNKYPYKVIQRLQGFNFADNHRFNI